MAKFAFVAVWLYCAWWTLPALFLTLPVLGIGFVVLALWPGPPKSRSWAQYEQDCLAGLEGENAQRRAESGALRRYVVEEHLGLREQGN